MRRLVMVAMVASCYAPTIAEDVPCGAAGACPTGHACVDGTCRLDGVAADASTDARADADAATPDAAFTCAGVDSATASQCVGTFSGTGAFFDVEAKQAIGITGFSTMSQNGGGRAIAVYYRPGTHVGFTRDAAGWTLLGTSPSFAPVTADACPIEPTLVPLAFCVEIPAGERAAFYIVTTAGQGSIESHDQPLGTVIAEDAMLRVYAGTLQQGLGAFAGTIVENKGWQGVIHTSR